MVSVKVKVRDNVRYATMHRRLSSRRLRHCYQCLDCHNRPRRLCNGYNLDLTPITLTLTLTLTQTLTLTLTPALTLTLSLTLTLTLTLNLS